MYAVRKREKIEAHRARMTREQRNRENPKDRQDRLRAAAEREERAKAQHAQGARGKLQERTAHTSFTSCETHRRGKVTQSEAAEWRELCSAAEAQLRIVVSELEKAGLLLYELQYSEAVNRVRLDQDERVSRSRLSLLEDDNAQTIAREAVACAARRKHAKEAHYSRTLSALDLAFQRECAAIGYKLAPLSGGAASSPTLSRLSTPSRSRAGSPTFSVRPGRARSPWLRGDLSISSSSDASPIDIYTRLVVRSHKKQRRKIAQIAQSQVLLPLSPVRRPPQAAVV